MEQPRQCGVQVVGLHGQLLQCQSIYASHLGLNSRYIITVAGTSNIPLNDQDLGKVSLHISCDNQTYFYHGELLSLQQEIKRCGSIGFQLTIGSALTRLDNDTNQRQFIDQTPLEIIQTLLNEYDIKPIFNIENLDYKLAYTAQGGTSDYDFLLQFCITHGIVFYFRHDKKAAKLYFSNKKYHEQKHHLIFNPGNGLVDNESVISSLNYWQVNLPENIYLTGAKEDEPDIIFQHQTTNTTSIPGQGVLKLSRPFIINNEKDCIRHARCLQQQLDWQREWVKIDLRDQTLQPGDTVQISHHPDSKLNRLYRVIETNFSQDTSNSTKAHRLHTSAYLIPAEVIYRMPEEYTRMHWPDDQEPPQCLVQPIQHPTPALMLSEISGDEKTANLDEQGRYRTRSLFNKQQNQEAKISPPLRQLQSAACPKASEPVGMHFPLMPNTRVIVAHTDNQLDKPLILGVLPESRQESPVISTNQTDLILRTQTGCSMAFKDSKRHQTISLHTQDSTHGLFLSSEQHDGETESEKVQDDILLNSIGSMDLRAEKEINLSTGNDLLISAEDAFFETDETLTLASKKEMTVKANTISLHAENDHQLQCTEGDISVHAEQKNTVSGNEIDFQAINMKFTAKHGELFAQSSLVLASKEISLQSGSSAMNLANGNILFQAPQITLDAPVIIKNQGIIAAVEKYLHSDTAMMTEHEMMEPDNSDHEVEEENQKTEPEQPTPAAELMHAMDNLYDYGQDEFHDISTRFNDWLATLHEEESAQTAFKRVIEQEQNKLSKIRLQDKEGYMLSEEDKSIILAVQEKIEQLQLTKVDDGSNPDIVHIPVVFDGTWNDRSKLENATNPNLLERLIDTDKTRARIYKKGVGTDPQTKWLGGALGIGAFARIDSAFKELANLIERIKNEIPNAEIVLSIIGFSRGATQARHFANSIVDYGVPDLSSNINGYYTRVLDKPRIGDMVLFDTVVALGLPGTPVKMGFKLGIPPSVENVLHITAIDEHRLFFPLHSVTDDTNDPRIIEIGLPGAHADIGGGYNNAYSKIALHLAYTYMKKLGIPLKSIENYPVSSVEDPDLRLHDSRYLTDKLWQNSKKVIGFQDHRQIYHIDNQ